MPFTEDARVKIPAILHLTRLGFDYLSLLINNLASIKHSPEFATNKSPLAPTNRLSTSLFSRDRLAFLTLLEGARIAGGAGWVEFKVADLGRGEFRLLNFKCRTGERVQVLGR